MKKLIIVLAVVILGFTSVAYAKDIFAPFWSFDVDIDYHEVQVFKTVDKTNDNICYISVTRQVNGNPSSAISCVK